MAVKPKPARALADLTPDPKNARVHTGAAVAPKTYDELCERLAARALQGHSLLALHTDAHSDQLALTIQESIDRYIADAAGSIEWSASDSTDIR